MEVFEDFVSRILKAIAIIIGCYVLFEIISYVIMWFRINGRVRRECFGLKPSAVDIPHVIKFAIFLIYYHYHAIKGVQKATLQYFFPALRQKVGPVDSVRQLLECVYVLYADHAPELGDPDMFRMTLSEFLTVLYPDRRDGSLLVDFNARTGLVNRFEYCGLTISNDSERLSLLVLTLATGIHPDIHLHQDEHYNGRQEAGKKYDNMFWHGPILNEFARFYPGILLRNLRWVKVCVDENSGKLQPRADHGQSLQKLLSFLGSEDLLSRVEKLCSSWSSCME